MASLHAVLAVTVDGRWRPGIGDPTFLGWFTALAYLLSALACRRAARRARGAQSGARRMRHAWTAFAVLMLALGINKQLDLQSLLSYTAKDMALAQGWYAERAQVQQLFISGVVALALLVGVAAAYWLRRELRDVWLAVLGSAFIVAFVFVRASSFHGVDQFLSTGPGGVRMNWILELSGITCVLLGAVRFRGRPPKKG
jgi:hypothetical protein